MVDASAPPIFIVGCQRSGTTLLRLMLDSHPSISCGPETRFLASLSKITKEDWPRLSQYGFPKEYWHGKVATLFDEFQTEYARSRGKERWADKTPMYALSLDYLNDLFPTCRIVHVIRDGRDVVASHRKRWGYVAAVKAVPKWPHYVNTARTVGRRLPPDRYLEVRYEDVVKDTEGTMRTILEFVGEKWDPAVLDHERQSHDVPAAYRSFSSERRSDAGEGGAVYKSRIGAGQKELDPVLRVLFKLVSGRMLRQLGYH